MRTNAKSIVVATALMVSACALQTSSAVGVSASIQINTVSDFYQPLTAQGSWVEVGSYGRCWRPGGVVVGWQPYVSGSWVWTDFGWYWQSDEPWGWACYHYGSWGYDSGLGWFWVPGISWSPAWVSWRTGGGYWGWAPIPPRGIAAPRTYVFVERRRFHEPIRPGMVIVNNPTIINQTTEIRNVRREVNVVQGGPVARVVVNEGPKRAEIEKATGTKVRELAVRDIPRPAPNPAAMQSTRKENQLKPTGSAVPDKPTPPEKPTPPDKPLPPERPTPPEKPLPPEKPGPVPPAPIPPERPVPPDPTVPPEKPVPLPRQNPPGFSKPSSPKPGKPRSPSERQEQGPKPDRNQTQSPQ